MIVSFVNVVEVHLLAVDFSPKDQIFFVRIVANASNSIHQKILVIVVVNVVLSTIITRQIKYRDLLLSISNVHLWWRPKKQKNKRINERWNFFFFSGMTKRTVQFFLTFSSLALSFFFSSFIPLRPNEYLNHYFFHFTPWSLFFFFSLHRASVFYFTCAVSLSLFSFCSRSFFFSPCSFFDNE